MITTLLFVSVLSTTDFSINPLDKSNNWTKLNTALALAEVATAIADYGSTRYCLQNIKYCSETNLLFGQQPNKLQTLITAIIIPVGGDIIVARLLPRYLREIWQVAYISNHLFDGPISNYKIMGGIHFAW